MKLARAGDYCLSQKGPAAGLEDAAARGAITASSTADAAAHGANMAVDGSSSTFWVIWGCLRIVAPAQAGARVVVRPVGWTLWDRWQSLLILAAPKN